MAIGIIDIEMGNLGSVKSHITKLGFDVCTIHNDRDYGTKLPETLILPGVGAYNEAMSRIKNNGIKEVIESHVNGGKQIVGICLGFQILFEEGTEGGTCKGLGLLPGKCIHIQDMFESDKRFIAEVPQVGFKKSKLPSFLNSKYMGLYFYYMHCYCIEYNLSSHNNENYGVTTINDKKYVTSVSTSTISGFQFHPEKSQQAGNYLMNLVLSRKGQ